MQILQQILFVLISILSIWFFTKKVREISRNIKLGRDEDFSDNKSQRWKNVLLLAFGQKKMFRNPLVAVLHFFVYAGFIIINIVFQNFICHPLQLLLHNFFGQDVFFLSYHIKTVKRLNPLTFKP